MKGLRLILGLALAIGLATSVGQAQQGVPTKNGPQANLPSFTVGPSVVYSSADFQSGGVGLRNQRNGGIVINGVSGAMRAAYVYWAIITQGAPTSSQKYITVQRMWPKPPNTPSTQTVVGAVVGTGPSPCWAGTQITVYRAALNVATVALGNGHYKVQLKAGATGSTAGQDPWVLSPLAMAEGASIVMIYTSVGTVGVFDVGLAGKTVLGGTLDYNLALSSAGTSFKYDSIGADGQYNASRSASAATAGETTFVNGLQIAGPGSAWVDSDWNGASSLPLPQLWDDHGHTFGLASTNMLNVVVNSPGDCITPVANIVKHQ